MTLQSHLIAPLLIPPEPVPASAPIKQPDLTPFQTSASTAIQTPVPTAIQTPASTAIQTPVQSVNFLTEPKVLSVHQSGFCKQHSTQTTVTYLSDYIQENMDKQQMTGAVFIDLKRHLIWLIMNVYCTSWNTRTSRVRVGYGSKTIYHIENK